MLTKLHEILNEDGTHAGRGFNWIISILIIISISILCCETFELSQSTRDILTNAETILVLIFTSEWILRSFTVKQLHPKHSMPDAIKSYLLTPYTIIDLLAILPFYIALVFPVDAGATIALRALRLIRLLKLGRYSKSLQQITNVFMRKKGQLFVTAYVSLIILLIISILMFYAEHQSQPDVFRNILDGLWWGIATLTTVGYGDIYPITTVGKIIAAISAFLGIGVFALPTAILGAAFLEEIRTEPSEPSQ